MLLKVQTHPAERAFTSDGSANSFVMVVNEKSFLRFSQNFPSTTRLKMFSLTTIIKLFVDQSEVNALSAIEIGKIGN